MCVLSIKMPIWKKSGNLFNDPLINHCRLFNGTSIFICIIMSHRQHGSPWPSLATRLYCPLFLVGLQGYILYRHRAGRLPFAHPCEWVHRSMSLMILSLLLQQCPAYLVHLAWIVFMMSGKWLYSSCFVRCCLKD